MATPYNSTQPDAPTGSSAINGILGLPDAMAQIADWIGGLVPSGATVYDTLNVDVATESGYSTTYLKVRRIGRIVFLVGLIVRTDGGFPFGNDTEPAFTVPNEMAPNFVHRFHTTNLFNYPNLANGTISINATTGTGYLGIADGPSGTVTGDTLYINTSWPV